jgi:hypothetical protein
MGGRRFEVSSDIEYRLDGATTFSCLFEKTEPARLPGIHDVPLTKISLVDGEGRAVTRAPLVDAAQRKATRPAQERAGEQHVATSTGAMALAHPPRETRLDVAGPEVNEIEPANFTPKEYGTVSPAQ